MILEFLQNTHNKLTLQQSFVSFLFIIIIFLKGERPQITDDTPEFYAELMRRCWDHNPENRPTAKEICGYLYKYDDYNRTEEEHEFIKLIDFKRQKIIKSDKFLSDTKSYRHHPE